MRLLGFNITRGSSMEEKATSSFTIDQLVARYYGNASTVSGASVTPMTCEQSPTVKAIVTAVSRRIATLPVKVMKRTASQGRVKSEPQPNHWLTRLLERPNDWQDPMQFWQDAASYLVRYGNFVAWKARGQTGPIRQLYPVNPGAVSVQQNIDWSVEYRLTLAGGDFKIAKPAEVLHARTTSRDGLWGVSTVEDIREAIALEIASERMGAAVFGNSAAPSLVFEFLDTHQGFKTDEEAKKFIDDFQSRYAKKDRFASMLLPKGMKLGTAQGVDNEKAQYLATRQYQRSVIAGAFGVPPHLVGDLTRGTFNNVEQQSLDFVLNVVLPYVKVFEAAMERSLLTDDDRREGIVIRFDLSGALRGDFKTRQEGLKIQREMGVINPNEWREQEGMNPIKDDDGGETYWKDGPSGQGKDQAAADAEAGKPADADKPQEPANDDEREQGARDERNA